MKLSTRIVYLSSKKAYDRFVEDTQAPEIAKERLWETIRTEIKGAAHWQENNPGSFAKLDDFPLTTYDDYQSTIAQSYQTGESLLCASKIICWGQSSGTTTKIPKVYPITKTYNRQMNAVNHAYSHAFLREKNHFHFGKALYFVANSLKQGSQDLIERQHMSHYGIQRMPSLIFNRSSVIPKSLYLSSDNHLNQWGALYALASELEYTTMILPGILAGLYKKIQENIDSYWPYLEGKKNMPHELPPLRCSAARLHHLQQTFARPAPLISEIWPSLHTVFSWRSGICEFQEQELRSVLGDIPIYNLPYCATEGYFTVPVQADSRGGVIHPGANIFEFLPINSEVTSKNLAQPWELKPGQQYELVMTSTMGLVRYRMQDIIQCTGFFNRSPIIEFVCKSSHALRLSKTNLFETNLAQAIHDAKFEYSGRWIFGPNKAGNALKLYLRSPEQETQGAPSSAPPQELEIALKRVDSALEKVNFSYGNERRLASVSKPTIAYLPYDHPIWSTNALITAKPRILLSVAP